MADLRLLNEEEIKAHIGTLVEALEEGKLAAYAAEYQGNTYTTLGVNLGPNGRTRDGEELEDAVPVVLLLPQAAWAESDIVDVFPTREVPDATS